jgi:hypothetical protein
MAKIFDPLEYNYESISSKDGIHHFQKVISAPPQVQDIIEISYWSKQKMWIIFMEAMNMKPFIELEKDMVLPEDTKIPLFIGEIKSAFEYELIIKRICTDPKILIQLGS